MEDNQQVPNIAASPVSLRLANRREVNRLNQQLRRQRQANRVRELEETRIANLTSDQAAQRLERRRNSQRERRAANRDNQASIPCNNNQDRRRNNLRRWRASLSFQQHQEQLANRRMNHRIRQREHQHENDGATNANSATVGTTSLVPLPTSHRFRLSSTTYEHGSTSGSTVHRQQQEEIHVETAHIADGEVNDIGQNRRRGNYTAGHNRARNFHESRGVPRFAMAPLKTCPYCAARLLPYETYELCCRKGKTNLPQISAPAELLDIFTDQTAEGRHFRNNIRSYNHIFSFTSMGVHLDDRLCGGERGVYTFRAQGSIYHRIGSLLPVGDERPRFLQMYVYDTDHELDHRMSENRQLQRDTVEKIKEILDAYNPFVHTFRQIAQLPDILHCSLIIREQPSDKRQYILPTASQVAAVIVGGDDVGNTRGRDIIVHSVCGQLSYIQDIVGFYDPLQYPLLLPFGTYGWDVNTRNNDGTRVTCRDYYAYRFQIRNNDTSLLLRGGRLLQQYVVDNYVKIESHRLRWIRDHQSDIRAELYDGLQDAFCSGRNNAGDIGRRMILPSSFVGCPRDMYQRYQDAMALVQKYGKPDLFVTITCNPNWEVIRNELSPGEAPQDRPDLLSRGFRTVIEEFKKDILTRDVLGKVIAYAYVIEFQKRGLPHMHTLLVLDESDKLRTPDDYDKIVRAEIPNKLEEPELHAAVLKHMIHGPCGEYNVRCPCMKNGKCKKKYPKAFSNETTLGDDSYPVYRRKPGEPVPLPNNSDILVDNSWVVPYNPWLLLRYDCHINVEICSSINSVKYLYKYVYKGPDRVALEVRPGPNYNEIRQFIDGRWICAPEAFWRIFKFVMNRLYPSVERLQIHLPNKQHVRFYRFADISSILNDDRCKKTMLTQFFAKNAEDEEARQYLYREFPQYYKWVSGSKIWEKRVSHYRVIGRIYTVSPSEGDRFFLRILLNHVRGPQSFEDILTVDGTGHQTFKQAAEARGLLETDQSIRQCLQEASTTHMPTSLRRMFATILVYCEPTGVRDLWNEFNTFMMEDYQATGISNPTNRLLRDMNVLLMQHSKSICSYDLPHMMTDFADNDELPRIIRDELSIPIPPEDVNLSSMLNIDQMAAYTTIIEAIENSQGSIFFVDGPGGTGKTYLYRALLAQVRGQGRIALATATSGIAATLLPGGRTAHSRFKLPLNPIPSSVCSITKQSQLADLIKTAAIILWDEATMTNRYAFEALDRTLRDITDIDRPFGGRVIVFGGDFRQVLPVIPKGTKAETINACIAKSPLWRTIKVLTLRQNMRSINDPSYTDFILRVGNGDEPTIDDDKIRIPDSMIIPWENENSINHLIEEIYPELNVHALDAGYMVKRGLITPRNEDVDLLNEKVLRIFTGQEKIYHSFDRVENDTQNLYQQEFLNSISPGGLPPHTLKLKVGAPVMLLRNLDPHNGLCNGTRLICRGLKENFIDAEILSGHFKGTRVFLHRIPLKPPQNLDLPFDMTRKQFPIRLSFALTINKAQGQTIPHVGIYLPEPVFSHGQLYVALSRGTSRNTTRILIQNGTVRGREGWYTNNVVYKDVLLSTS